MNIWAKSERFLLRRSEDDVFTRQTHVFLRGAAQSLSPTECLFCTECEELPSRFCWHVVFTTTRSVVHHPEGRGQPPTLSLVLLKVSSCCLNCCLSPSFCEVMTLLYEMPLAMYVVILHYTNTIELNNSSGNCCRQRGGVKKQRSLFPKDGVRICLRPLCLSVRLLPVTTLGILVMKLLTVLMGTPSVSSWIRVTMSSICRGGTETEERVWSNLMLWFLVCICLNTFLF